MLGLDLSWRQLADVFLPPHLVHTIVRKDCPCIVRHLSFHDVLRHFVYMCVCVCVCVSECLVYEYVYICVCVCKYVWLCMNTYVCK